MPDFDFRNPDYAATFRARADALARMRAAPERLPALKVYYRDHIADFIDDWGCTVDPRNVSKSLPAFLPFRLMPKQRELVDWMIERWKKNESGIVEKSRDVGASWLAMATAVSMCLFHDGIMVGVGSAKEDKLDRTGDPDTIFYKARTFIESLPPEFRNGFDGAKDSLYMRLLFRATGSSITGEAGDQIGRGGRKSIFLLDESAHIDHPDLVDASLVATTDCRIDISSVNGMANSFAIRRHSGKFPVFTYHYRDDLRKDAEWERTKQSVTDPVTWEAEYNLNYLASIQGIVIEQAWARACVDAHKVLGIEPSGIREGALDFADQGKDMNAFAARHGVLLMHSSEWSGQGSRPTLTVERCFMLCDEMKLDAFVYDADGMGATLHDPCGEIAARRKKELMRDIGYRPFKGSDAVLNSESIALGTEIKNKDRYANRKAQAWFDLRRRVWLTFQAVNGAPFDRDNIISIDSRIPDLQKLLIELSQAQWKHNPSGKILIDKTPDGAKSPNRADSVVYLFAEHFEMKISDEVLNYEPDFDEEYA